MKKAILRSRLYVPVKYIKETYFDSFNYSIEDPACARCKDKDKDGCLDCPLSEAKQINTYTRMKGMYAFCRGNLGKIYKVFRKFDIVNETAAPKFQYDLKFTTDLWDNQKNTVNTWLKYKYGIIESPPRSGKATPLYSKIKISNGWVRMGDIKLGDLVSTPDGKEAPVTGIFPQGLRPTYRVTFEDGRTTDCDEDHLWKVYNRHWGKSKSRKKDGKYIYHKKDPWRVLSLKDIMNKKSKYPLYIPLLKEVHNDEKDLSIDPYVLGVLLGDGYLGKTIQLTNIDVDILKNVTDRLVDGYCLKKDRKKDFKTLNSYSLIKLDSNKENFNYYNHAISSLGLRYHCSHEKFIPEIYKESSVEQRLELLRGLMDTDGGADKVNVSNLEYKVERAGRTPYFGTSSHRLALDVQYLVRSLGGLCKIHIGKSFYTYKGVKKEGRTAYRCSIRFNKPEELYKIDRKKERVIRSKDITLRCKIKSINYLGIQETQCISIDHSDHLYITDNFVVTHNTMMSCYIACLLGLKTLIVAHQSDLLDQFYTTLLNHTNLKVLRKECNTDKIVGLTNCRDNISEYDICLTTYQSFISEMGSKQLELIRNSFGLVVVDECHLSGADCYRKMVDRINSRYRLGLSATPERKDKLQCLVYDILGPVTAHGVSNEMHCIVENHNTGYHVGKFTRWQTFTRQLCENNKRNKLICKQAIKDVAKGRYVLIVTERKAHIDKLVEMLRDKDIKVASYDGRIPKNYREKFLNQARSGELEVVVAMRKMIKLGIDVPLWDVYYYIMPIGYDKNYYQEMSRVRTPYPKELKKKLGHNKPTPIIRMFLDFGHGAVYACHKIANKVNEEQGFTFKESNENFNEQQVHKKSKW